MSDGILIDDNGMNPSGNLLVNKKWYTQEQIQTAVYLFNWLVDHKIQCQNKNCLCDASTPVDALCELYEETADGLLAEALHLDKEKINEVIQNHRNDDL